MSRSDAAVEIRGLTKVYDGRAVLQELDLAVLPGEFVSVLGPSGTGKTTLLRILSGLETADEGQVLVPRVRSVVFQEPRLVPARRVWRNVVLGSRATRKASRQARQALAEVGLADKAGAWPETLSGGEAQRVALARALVRRPQLLLLDEPFASVDALTRIRMHALVKRLWAEHHPAVLLVTHDVDEAILLSDRIIVLFGGAIRIDVSVDADASRDRGSEAFLDLRSSLIDKLGVADVP